MDDQTSNPAIFHVTHWKAGSQWVRAVLAAAAPGRVRSPDHDPGWFANVPIVGGGVYTPVYARFDQFRAVVPESRSQRTFVVIRDLRDTAVSWYFSHRYSHSLADPTVRASRDILARLDKTDGMALVISNHLRDAADIQQSWINSGGARVFRYEDLRRNQNDEFGRMLDYCGLDVPEAARRRILARNSFERKTWWRLGRERVRSHLRKGVAGDWRNHFCGRLKKLFKVQYGELLVRAGYEADDSW